METDITIRFEKAYRAYLRRNLAITGLVVSPEVWTSYGAWIDSCVDKRGDWSTLFFKGIELTQSAELAPGDFIFTHTRAITK